MRRLTKAERAAAAAVLAAAAGVAVTGMSLLKKHAKFMAKKAAATFKEEEGFEEAELDLEEEDAEADAVGDANEEEPKERQYIKL